MKSCDEMAKDVFRRIEEHKTERRERRKKTVRMLIVVACFCVSITVVASGATAVYYVIQKNYYQAGDATSSESASSKSDMELYEVVAYFDTGSENFTDEFSGVAVGGQKEEKTFLDNEDDYDKRFTKTLFGTEDDYGLVSVYSNHYIENEIFCYNSLTSFNRLEINAQTGEVIRFWDDAASKNEDGERVEEWVLIENAIEYVSEFTNDDLSDYAVSVKYSTDDKTCFVSFYMSAQDTSAYCAYGVSLRALNGVCYEYTANVYNGMLKKVNTEMMDKAIYTAEMKMIDLCKENGILFNYTQKRSAKMVYSAEDGCPVMLVTYSLAGDSPKAAGADIVFFVKIR